MRPWWPPTNHCGHSSFYDCGNFLASARFKSESAGPRPTSLFTLACAISPFLSRSVALDPQTHCTSFTHKTIANPPRLSGIVTSMNPGSEMTTFDHIRHNTFGGFILVPAGRQVVPSYVETDMGPWGWQWRGGARSLVSVPPASIPITIKTLMDDIEKVGRLQTPVMLITDDDRLGSARDVQNCHRLGLFKVS
jgi:hypothetical protein